MILGLGTTDVLTAQFFCDLIGISTVETESIRKSNSIEGEWGQFGEKNISTLKRNLLNKDEILRIDSKKLLVILRGNKPLLLEKMRYTEHPLAKQLKESSIYDYNPKWIMNNSKVKKEEKFVRSKPKDATKLNEKKSFDTF